MQKAGGRFDGFNNLRYMWPRDGAIVVYALDRMEYIMLSENFRSEEHTSELQSH